MSLNSTLLAEFQQEAATTRKLLALVPFEQSEYKPHEKSMSLMRLATHVAEIAGWWKECLKDDELDFAKGDFTPKVFKSTDELLAMFDDYVAKSTIILNETPESEFEKNWTMRQGEMIFFTLPKAQVVRTWCLNHWVHHRAQLGVYLRMLNIPIPGSYGPSADDNG